ncbi:riboflavin kinase [Candidatus Uhrbacteria bacterium]|nr:riboflavin kinase [Candidatus Uhrbacteria bacterium]
MEEWIAKGRVCSGMGRARDLGCPTANLVLERKDGAPDPGVYVAYAAWDAERAPALVCVHPPSSGGNVKVETHVLEVDVDLREKDMRLEARAKLRDFVPWTTEAAMRKLIQNDISDATEWFEARKYLKNI